MGITYRLQHNSGIKSQELPPWLKKKKRLFLNQKDLLAQTGRRGTEPETSPVLFRSLHAKKPRLAVFCFNSVGAENQIQGSQCSRSFLVMFEKPYAVLGITSGVPEPPPAS